jgi:hypothetical protein
MATVNFTPNLQRHLALTPADVSGDSLSEILKTLFAHQAKLEGYLLDDQGALRKHMNIFIDGTAIRDRRTLSDAVSPHSEVFIVQALSGG